MRVTMALLAVLLLVTPQESDKDMRDRAEKIASEVIIADTHIDVPYRLHKKMEDISKATERGDFDYPRARRGGLDAIFMSIYTPPNLEATGHSKLLADTLINMVEGFVVNAPDKFGMATTVDEVKRLFAEERIALLLGMENGSPIEGELSNLEYFHKRGVRYITLAHSKANHISDSSYDEERKWGGLSPFGEKVVAEMNRLGIMIDISHLSDDAADDVLDLTKAPVIASHSSCRHFTPGFERNMDDKMIKRLAKNGGVLHINFGSVFVNDEVRRKHYVATDAAKAWARENDLPADNPKVRAYRDAYLVEHPRGFADIEDVVDHIDHVVKLVGVDYVGFGSDYDGVGDSLPTGLKDVSTYPNLIEKLLERGYSEEDIAKMCSGNVFRVMDDCERVASELSASR